MCVCLCNWACRCRRRRLRASERSSGAAAAAAASARGIRNNNDDDRRGVCAFSMGKILCCSLVRLSARLSAFTAHLNELVCPLACLFSLQPTARVTLSPPPPLQHQDTSHWLAGCVNEAKCIVLVCQSASQPERQL